VEKGTRSRCLVCGPWVESGIENGASNNGTRKEKGRGGARRNPSKHMVTIKTCLVPKRAKKEALSQNRMRKNTWAGARRRTPADRGQCSPASAVHLATSVGMVKSMDLGERL